MEADTNLPTIDPNIHELAAIGMTSVGFGSYTKTGGSETKILGFRHPSSSFYEARLMTDGTDPAKLLIKQETWRDWAEPKSDGIL